MFMLILKGIWSFLTSKIGVAFLIISILALGVWQIYEAGARSTEKDAAEKVAAIQDKLDALNKEKQDWKSSLDAAVKKAQDAQASIVAGLKSQLDELEKRKPIVKTIIKEVPKYVTAIDDSKCAVNTGFIWLYNATLQADAIPGSGPANADTPSGFALSDIAGVAADNNTECYERGEIISLWQDWYVKNKTLFDEISEKANSR
jgi:hypothetical protein